MFILKFSYDVLGYSNQPALQLLFNMIKLKLLEDFIVNVLILNNNYNILISVTLQ